MTATTNDPGNLDHEEGKVSNQLQKIRHVEDDTTCDVADGNQTQEPEDECHQRSHTHPLGGFGSPEMQRSTDDSEQKPTDVLAEHTPEASFDEDEQTGNADNQKRGEGHEDDRTPDVHRSKEDEQSQAPLEEELMTNEKYDGESMLNEENRQWEESDGLRGDIAEKQNISSFANKLRYVWRHKQRMRERGKTTAARSRGFYTRHHLHPGQKHTLQGDNERTQLPTSSLVYPQTVSNTRTSKCIMPSFYATWSGYRVRACGVKQAVWPTPQPPRVTSNVPQWTTRDAPWGNTSTTASTSRFQCSRREGIPAEPPLSVRGAGVDVVVPKTKTTKTLVWGPLGPREIKSVWVLQAHNSRWRNSN
ncbi:hypothetical protein AALO_G00069630 [Alosa alosa]|uniref:Uncharacterized protein n=1 Tax=Alosa alosa TaxID=278164 RepID=A0AAV6H1X4_9TELE|nr:uncharacterized protein LOC125294845 isoform X1 [Alosa alosa]XP_048099834.1 uncharacterized protein LOC125294845 isoform X1 [Alosa alosa]KAG5281299.1 hypothetical protein AALO_G00069630 [Alosa alosa]